MGNGEDEITEWFARRSRLTPSKFPIGIGDDMADYPYPAVQPFEAAVGCGIDIGRAGKCIALNVHDENAEDGEAAKGIEGDADIAHRREFLRKIGYKS